MTRPPGPATSAPDESLREIDAALIGLRRLWSAPPRLDDPQLGRVDMSTIWVAEALVRLTDGARETTVCEVASVLDVAPSTASRLVDRAERSGVVRRGRSAADARRAALTLTSAGRELAGRSAGFRLGYLDRVTRTWPPQQRRRFAQLLTDFVNSVHRTPPGREPS